MRPLLFLTFRCFVNGLRRGLTSPKRLVTTAVILLYYFYWFVRPLMMSSTAFHQSGWTLPVEVNLPPLASIDACVFAAFAGLSLILSLGLFGYRSSFKPADVDVLFPTPISPRTVLTFRIVRDYLGTLLIPLFLIILTWRPFDLQAIFSNVPHPHSSGYVFRALFLGFTLVTTAWVGMGYALSLYVNRNDRRSEARKKIIGWFVALPPLIVLGYAVRAAAGFRAWSDFVHFAQQDWLRIFFFTATPASRIVMGPLEGNAAEMIVGAGTLILISAASLYLAIGQAEWMYDQAAVRGFGAESMRQLQRKGDMMGLMAEAARLGKIKVRKPGWFQSLRPRGLLGLIWKDVLIQWRSIRGIILIFVAAGMTFVVLPSLAGHGDRSVAIMGIMVIVAEAFVAFMVATMTSQTGFTELLRRVDLQKPLPFGPQVIVMSEVLAKALPAVVIPLICGLVSLALLPGTWLDVIAGALFFPSFAWVICSLVCVIVLLFPEIDDVSQRGFRGLMMLFGMVLVGTPGVLTFIAIGAFTKTAIIGALPAAIVNCVVGFGLTALAGSLYASFNPSE